jgi:hypothetical protein
MQNVNFLDNHKDKLDFRNLYAVVYAHSFTDAQQINGGDTAFLNMYDWLYFTLRNLKDKNIILKAHPNIYSKDYETDVLRWDKEIWNGLILKFKSFENIQIVDWPMRNIELLKLIPKETVLISHHGNALLEGAGIGFRCIASASSVWQKFKLMNSWRSRNEYLRLLRNPNLLSKTDVEKIYRYIDILFNKPTSYHSENSFHEIIAKNFGISSAEFFKKPSILSKRKDIDYNLVTKELSKNISILDEY